MKCLKSVLVVSLFAFILLSFSGTSEAKKKKGQLQLTPLEEVEMYLEVNATDGDAEVVIEVETDAAIRRMSVRDPNGRAILDVKSKDRVKLGLAEILIESAEPDIDRVLAAYPEGVYTIKVRTVDGELLVGTAELSHDILPAPTISITDVEGGIMIEWDAIEGADDYLIGIETEDEDEEEEEEEDEEEDEDEEEIELELEVEVGAGTTNLFVPEALLIPGMTYEIEVGVESEDDNITVSETELDIAEEA